MKYFRIDKEEDNTYTIWFSEAFYKIFSPCYKGNSYWNVMYRLWDLTPQDFYHYCGATYNAFYKPSDCIRHIKMFFISKNDAEAFCREAEKRINMGRG